MVLLVATLAEHDQVLRVVVGRPPVYVVGVQRGLVQSPALDDPIFDSARCAAIAVPLDHQRSHILIEAGIPGIAPVLRIPRPPHTLGVFRIRAGRRAVHCSRNQAEHRPATRAFALLSVRLPPRRLALVGAISRVARHRVPALAARLGRVLDGVMRAAALRVAVRVSMAALESLPNLVQRLVQRRFAIVA